MGQTALDRGSRQRTQSDPWAETAQKIEQLEGVLEAAAKDNPASAEALRAHSKSLSGMREDITKRAKELTATDIEGQRQLGESLVGLRDAAKAATASMQSLRVEPKALPFGMAQLGAPEAGFTSSFQLVVPSGTQVTVKYSTPGLSGDLSLGRVISGLRYDSGRHLEGLIKESRVLERNGAERHTISFEKGFNGSAEVIVGNERVNFSQTAGGEILVQGHTARPIPAVNVDPDRILSDVIRVKDAEAKAAALAAARAEALERAKIPRREEVRNPPPTVDQKVTPQATLPKAVATTTIPAGAEGQGAVAVHDPSLQQEIAALRRQGFEVVQTAGKNTDGADTVTFELRKGTTRLHPPLTLAGKPAEAAEGALNLSPDHVAQLKSLVSRVTGSEQTKLRVHSYNGTEAVPLTAADGALYEQLRKSDNQNRLALVSVDAGGNAVYRYYRSEETSAAGQVPARFVTRDIPVAAGADRNAILSEALASIKTSTPVVVAADQSFRPIAVDAAVMPDLHQALESAKAAGLTVRVVGEKRDGGYQTEVTLQAYQPTPNNGQLQPVGKPIAVAMKEQDNRSEAVRELASRAEHLPIYIGSKIGAVSTQPITFEQQPEVWKVLDGARQRGLEITVTKRGVVGNVTTFTYELLDKAGKSASGPIAVRAQAADYHDERNRLLVAAVEKSQSNGKLESVPFGSEKEHRIYAETRPETFAALQRARAAGVAVEPAFGADGSIDFRFRSEKYNRMATFSVKLTAEDLKTTESSDKAFAAKVGSAIDRLSKPYEFLITDHANTTPEFRAQVRQGLSQVPAVAIDLLLRENYKIHAQQFMLQDGRTYAGQPRGYSKEATWNLVRGLHSGAEREIILNEQYFTLKGKWESASDTVASTSYHEVGHAIDHIVGTRMLTSQRVAADRYERVRLNGVSASLDFDRAFLTDHAGISAFDSKGLADTPAGTATGPQADPPSKELAYFLQPGTTGNFDDGRSECFAECVRVLLEGKSSARYESFQRHFPRALEAAQQILETQLKLTEDQMPGSPVRYVQELRNAEAN